jgi:hypothetical protein
MRWFCHARTTPLFARPLVRGRSGRAWAFALLGVMLAASANLVPAFSMPARAAFGCAFNSSGFAAQQTFATGPGPTGIAVADINSDGKPDVVASDIWANMVSVLLNTTVSGSGTPSFAAQQSFAAGVWPGAVAAGDYNADGKPDVAVTNQNSNTVSVLLNTTVSGSGTASFATQQTFATGTTPFSVAVADIDADGKPDLIVANGNSDTLSVLVNTTAAGGGIPTFAAQQTFATGTGPTGVAVGDINGDGKPDLAVANSGSATVSVLLNTTVSGGGTASFAAQQTFASASNSQAVAIADLDGDDRPDVVLLSTGPNPLVSVLRNTTVSGSSTPSFAGALTFAAGSFAQQLAVADITGDDRPDLVVTNSNAAIVLVLVNSTVSPGSAITFAPPQPFATGPGSAGIAVADLNADGKPDLAVANQFLNNMSVLLNTCGPPPLLISPSSLPAGQVGTAYSSVLAASNGTSPYVFTSGALPPGLSLSSAGLLSGTPTAGGGFSYIVTAIDAVSTTGARVYSQTIMPAITSTTLAALPGGGSTTYGQNVTLTATLSRSAATGTVTFIDNGSTTLGAGTLAAGVATFSTTALGAGGHSFTAHYSGDVNNAISTSSALPYTVAMAPQTLTFGVLADKLTTDADFALSATASSTLTVVFQSTTTSVCSVSGLTMVHLVTVGTCSIQATQGGNANYSAAAPVAQSFAVRGPQTITFSAPGNTTYGAPPLTLSANSTSGLVVSFAPTTSSVCATSGPNGATLSLVGAGTCTINASQTGNASYLAAPVVGNSFTIAQASTSVLLTPSANIPVSGQSVLLTAQVSTLAPSTGVVTGDVTFLDGSTSLGAAPVNGAGRATFTTVDTLDGNLHSLTAVYAGDANVTGSTSNVLTLAIGQAATTTTLADSAPSGTSSFGVPGTLTASVAIAAPGTGTLSGQVVFVDGATTLGTVALQASGEAAFIPAPTQLAVGAHSIVAQFGGSATLASSSSSALTVTVSQAASSTRLVISPGSTQQGDTVVFAATVASLVTGTGTPSGNVVFVDNGNTVVTVSLDGNGLATWSTGDLGVGTHGLTAQYTGDVNFSGSLGSGTSTLTVSARPSPSTGGGGGGGSHSNSSRPAPPVQTGDAGGGGGGAPVFAPPPAPVSSPPSASQAGIVVVSQPNGATSSAPSDGVIRFTVADGPGQTSQAELRLDPALSAAVPSALQLRVIVDSQPSPPDAANPANLGGGVAQPLAPPLYIRLLAIDRTSGQLVPLPAGIASMTIQVRLPQSAVTPAAGEEAAWLMEVDDGSGTFLGYVRPPSTLDSTTQQVVLTFSVNQLTGTLFLPVLLRIAYVRNFDPGAHMWSSPFSDAIDFGVAAPQWTRMQVMAPQIGQRLPVLNAFTGASGWIDAGGVGLVATNDEPPAVPAAASVPVPDAILDVAPPADVVDDVPPADLPILPVAESQPTMTAYTIQSGDTLKGIAAQAGTSLEALLAANRLLDPDQLTVGQQIQLPLP